LKIGSTFAEVIRRTKFANFWATLYDKFTSLHVTLLQYSIPTKWQRSLF